MPEIQRYHEYIESEEKHKKSRRFAVDKTFWEKLFEKNSFDAIVCMYFPLEALIAGQILKKKHILSNQIGNFVIIETFIFILASKSTPTYSSTSQDHSSQTYQSPLLKHTLPKNTMSVFHRHLVKNCFSYSQ